MKMDTIETSLRPPQGLETIDVTLTVTRFQSVLEAAKEGSSLTDFTLTGPEEGNARLKVGDFQKGSPPGARHTLRVQRPGVVFRFTVAGGADGESYLPVGISFERADQTEPMAVTCTTEARNKSDSPFSSLEISGPTIRFIDRPLSNVRAKGEESPPRRVTYKFSVVIQRQRDGALGVIDPTIENENLA